MANPSEPTSPRARHGGRDGRDGRDGAADQRRLSNRQTPKRRLWADRFATGVVSAGGLAIIASILGILLFIALEVWPLTRPARVTAARQVSFATAPIGAVLVDEHRSHAATLDRDGRVRVVRLDDGRVVAESDLAAVLAAPASPAADAAVAAGAASAPRPTFLALANPPQSRLFAASTSDGRVMVKSMNFTVSFEGDKRVVTPDASVPVALELDPEKRPLGAFAAHEDDTGAATAAAQLADGTLAVARRNVEENAITGEKAESVSRFAADLPAGPPGPPAATKLTALVIDPAQKNLYAGTADGRLVWWELADGQPAAPKVSRAGAAVTALTLLPGGRSLVAGQADGRLSIWFAVRQKDDSMALARAHEFPRHPGAVWLLAPSPRDKGFLALGGGRLGLYFSTSERTLWTGGDPLGESLALAYSPKADAAFVASAGKIAELAVENPHPEINWQALFGKNWYEGYDKPEYVWQSSGGSDDFEPKLSLVPLLIGTLKGTFYSLLLAIPLGVFGAMYTSQFMHPTYKRYLKPIVEIMASLPSVVLGFLAGLWLAPRIERAFSALLLMAVLLPALVLATGFLWSRLPRAVRNRVPVGSEAILFVFVLAFGLWLSVALARPFEMAFFGGHFQTWLLELTGLQYDQRNAVVVGLAMGFAVIPIIFAIAEDAFSNVPQNLVAGSLALGADRWQTVTRVVLPTASPGIFSAIMIGFGRAIGETMIVLMATGNTPILDWNPFNGFRTLSANIAVEIPEAPKDGTLYRTLFLAGLLLFVLTFVVNTGAEIVRQRLRRRYSQL
jgi:phosphate transport system permease protein